MSTNPSSTNQATQDVVPAAPVLRVARPTTSISALLPFYIDGLGFQVLSKFTDHEGFDGIMLGHPGWPYHLEFTEHQSISTDQVKAPSEDNLLVFYIEESEVWQARTRALRLAGFEPVKSNNPYWEKQGLTFEDSDGWRVVLWKGKWES